MALCPDCGIQWTQISSTALGHNVTDEEESAKFATSRAADLAKEAMRRESAHGNDTEITNVR